MLCLKQPFKCFVFIRAAYVVCQRSTDCAVCVFVVNSVSHHDKMNNLSHILIYQDIAVRQSQFYTKPTLVKLYNQIQQTEAIFCP